jgi:hypothetical protein
MFRFLLNSKNNFLLSGGLFIDDLVVLGDDPDQPEK